MRLIVIAVVTLVVALVVWRACTSGTSDVGAYIDSVRPSIQKSNELGSALRALPAEMPALNRDIFEQRMSQWETTSVQLERDVMAVKAKKGAEGESSYLVAALHARAVGFKNFKQSMINAMEGVPADQVTAELLNAVADFDAGDRSYSYFANDSRRVLADRHEDKIEVPVSQYLKDSPYAGPEAAKFVKSVQSQPKLAPIHDLAIAQVTTRPAAAGKSKDIDLLPAASSFQVQVTISNDGNLPEHDITVKLRLTAETQPQPQESQQTIPVLETGGKKVLVFTDLNPARGEARNTLTIDVDPANGEKNLQNNHKEYSFAMRG